MICIGPREIFGFNEDMLAVKLSRNLHEEIWHIGKPYMYRYSL